nr:STAS domain-containing protein [Bacillus piscicola]
MDFVFHEDQTIKEFIMDNKDSFEKFLLSEAVNVRDKIDEIRLTGNINLIHNAHQLVGYIIDQKEEELVAFAKQEGEVWAKFALTLDFKLEWVQAIRRTIWNYLHEFDRLHGRHNNRDEFYEMEKTVNDQIDRFLNVFFIRYTNIKDDLIESQKQLVENLSVPVIPITSSICVLPLIGALDVERITTIEEKILTEIRKLRVSRLILDLSGMADIEEEAIDLLFRVIEGVAMMGCDTVITGLRPDIIRKIINLGYSFDRKAETKGTLQQALKDYL